MRCEWEGTSDSPKALLNPELGEYKGSVGSCPRVSRQCSGFFSAVYTGFFLVLDLRGRVLGGKVGGARWEFEDNDGGILG